MLIGWIISFLPSRRNNLFLEVEIAPENVLSLKEHGKMFLNGVPQFLSAILRG